MFASCKRGKAANPGTFSISLHDANIKTLLYLQVEIAHVQSLIKIQEEVDHDVPAEESSPCDYPSNMVSITSTIVGVMETMDTPQRAAAGQHLLQSRIKMMTRSADGRGWQS